MRNEHDELEEHTLPLFVLLDTLLLSSPINEEIRNGDQGDANPGIVRTELPVV
jgi:hypothetical protein